MKIYWRVFFKKITQISFILFFPCSPLSPNAPFTVVSMQKIEQNLCFFEFLKSIILCYYAFSLQKISPRRNDYGITESYHIFKSCRMRQLFKSRRIVTLFTIYCLRSDTAIRRRTACTVVWSLQLKSNINRKRTCSGGICKRNDRTQSESSQYRSKPKWVFTPKITYFSK